MTRIALAAASAFLLVACGQYDPEPSVAVSQSNLRRELRPHQKHLTQQLHDQIGGRVEHGASAFAGTTGYGIQYHGGPVMHGTVNAYFIWYGNWSGNTATTILTDFIRNLGGSPYYNINTTYGDSSGGSVANSIHYAGAENDNYSQGTALSDANIQTIVQSHIGSGHFPLDSNGIYFVLTSSDVNETSGFCTQYCGWHTHGTISGSDIKYSFVGNADRCPSACAAQTTGPNGNAGADGMASIIAHEFEETASDPDINAWYDSTGAENGDKCAWNFGTEYTTSNGAKANMKLGTRDFLIQQNWLNTPPSGGCALAYATSPDFTISASPSSQSVAPGASTTYTVTVAANNGFSGSVALAVSGLGGGATGTFSPSSISGGGTSTLTVSTTAAAATGTFSLTITGTSGALSHSTGVSLTVAKPGTSPIVNGGFETGDFTGWTRSGSTSITGTSHSGAHAAFVGSTNPSTTSSIAQTFTVPSTGGTLSFWYQVHCPDTVTYDWATATLKDNSTGKTTTLLPKTCTNNGTWMRVSSSVGASAGHSVTLTLTSRDDNYPGDPTYTLYDDVQLQ